MDIFILKPINLGNGNHRMLLDFNNRGEDAPGPARTTSPLTNDPTHGRGCRHRVRHEPGLHHRRQWMGCRRDRLSTAMKISVPVATNPDGSPITGPSYEYSSSTTRTSTSFALTYPAATPDKSQATLTVRARLNDAPVTVPASGWEYTSAAGTAIRLLPARATPFQQSAIYEFTYTAKNPVVAAIGLAATRDFVSFLRHGDGGPGQSARRRRAAHLQLFHLAAVAHVERLRATSASTRTKTAAASSTAY